MIAATKRTLIRQCLVVAILCAACSILTSQTTSEISQSEESENKGAESGTLYLQFLDSTTGGAVKPDKILLNGKPLIFKTEAGSVVELHLPDGDHSMGVQAKDYEPMEFSANVSGDATPVMQIEMDSAKVEDTDPVAEDAAVLEGNISDADTGALLEKVKVTMPDARMSTVTDQQGYYRFDVVTGENNPESLPAIIMEVKADGYTPLRLKNVGLAPGERRRMPLRLDKSTTDTATNEIVEIDEGMSPGQSRTSDWVFDVTIH